MTDETPDELEDELEDDLPDDVDVDELDFVNSDEDRREIISRIDSRLFGLFPDE